MSFPQIASVVIFIGSVALIATEKVKREVAALLGGSLVIVLGILPQDKAFHYIDLNTLGLLLGMMVVAGVLKETGLFEYLAIKAIKLGKGNGWIIFMYLSGVTALVSTVINNVTTVLLVAPIALSMAEIMKINALPYLYGIVFASNIGGTATLIGDPPNVMIGSFAHLSFMDFIYNLAPVVFIIMLSLPLVIKVFFGNLTIPRESWDTILRVDEGKLIKDSEDLKLKILILLGIILGFVFHGYIGLPAATVAVFGAMIMILPCGEEADRIIKESVELNTLLFFIGFFIMVGALEHTGVINSLGNFFVKHMKGKPVLASNVLLWGSGFISAFVDNIPYTAAMLYFVDDLIRNAHFSPAFWWVLALGTCLGGNGTLIGASPNIVVAEIAKKSGYKITFADFLKIGMFTMILCMVISSIYVALRYFM